MKLIWALPAATAQTTACTITLPRFIPATLCKPARPNKDAGNCSIKIATG